jgi:hypothetical protein
VVATANPSEQTSIAKDGGSLELLGSALWNKVHYCDAVGDYAYLTMDFGLMIVDVSDRSNPQAVGRVYMPEQTFRLNVVGDYAYVCGGGDLNTGKLWATLTIVDVSDPHNPYVTGCYQNADSILGYSVKVDGDYAYVGGDRLMVLDISNPSMPWPIGYYDHNGHGMDLEIVADTVFMTTANSIYVLDISTPWSPERVYPWSIYTATSKTNGIQVANGLFYVADWHAGLSIIDPLVGNPHVIGGYDLPSMATRDLALVDDTIVFFGGEDENSARVLNVADPYAVVSIAECGGFGSPSTGMDYDSDHLYVSRNDQGLFIHDVSDRAAPIDAGIFRECYKEPRALAVQGTIGYVAFMDTIRIMDLSDPADITQLSCVKIAWSKSIVVTGNLMLVGNYRGVTSYDVSNPTALVRLDELLIDYPGVIDIAIRGDYAYITMKDYGWGVVDISDPSNLTMTSEFADNDYEPTALTYGRTKLMIVDDYVIACFDSPEAYTYGFLILDVSDPSSIHPVKEHVLPARVGCVEVIDSLLYFGITNDNFVRVWDISDLLNPVQIAMWYPEIPNSFSTMTITDFHGYLLLDVYPTGALVAVDPTGWIDTCTYGEIARFPGHRVGTDIATVGRNIYQTTYGGLTVLRLALDFNCGDINGDGSFEPDIADLIYLVTYMFQEGPEPPDMAACDIDGNGTPVPDITDLIYLVTYMFQDGPPPICQ